MFTFFIKFSIYFTLSFLILSIPINQKRVFDYLSHLAAPYTRQIFGIIQDSLERQIAIPQDLSRKLFDITPPNLHEKTAAAVAAGREKFAAEEEQMLEKVMEKINAENSWRK